MRDDNLSNLLSLASVQEAEWAICRIASGAGVKSPPRKQVQCFLMVEGELLLHMGGASGSASATVIRSGDIVVSLGGTSIAVRECEDASTMIEDFPAAPAHDRLPWLQIGKSEPKALMILGRFGIDSVSWGPIRRAVPDVLISHSTTGALPYWAGALSGIRPLQLALSGEGAAALARSLAEMCLIQVIRAHRTHNRPKLGRNGEKLVDPRLADAIRQINSYPARNWTVADLATKVGMSRSVFSEAFEKAIGEAPIRYLTRVRMTLAAQMLRNESAPLIEIAHQVGYSSDISLIRTFKRFYSITPSEFRQHLAANVVTEVAHSPLSHPAFVFDAPLPGDAF